MDDGCLIVHRARNHAKQLPRHEKKFLGYCNVKMIDWLSLWVHALFMMSLLPKNMVCVYDPLYTQKVTHGYVFSWFIA